MGTPTSGSRTLAVRTAFSVSCSLCELPSAADRGFSDEGGSDLVIYGHNNELMSCWEPVLTLCLLSNVVVIGSLLEAMTCVVIGLRAKNS